MRNKFLLLTVTTALYRNERTTTGETPDDVVGRDFIIMKLPTMLFPSMLMILFLLCCSFCCTTVSSETEIKWTPNSEDQQQQGGGDDTADAGAGAHVPAAGPLPLSQKQREQLLQLEQAIRQSPNPQDTLVKAAQANGMDPNDLLSLLERNHNDMVQAGGGGMAQRKPTNVLLKIVSSMGMMVVHSASKHPKAFVVLFTALIVISYIGITAPRTGLELSSHRFPFLSNGPTTFWDPPTSYVQRRHLTDSNDERGKRRHSKSEPVVELYKDLVPLLEEEDDDDEDGEGGAATAVAAVWYTQKQLRKNKIPNIKQAASAQARLRVSDFIDDDDVPPPKQHQQQQQRRRRRLDDEEEEEEEDEDEEEGEYDDDDDDELTSEVLDLLLVHASDVVSSGKLTELIPTDSGVRFVVPATETTAATTMMKRHQRAVLIVRGMGDWKRYGLLPLRVVSHSLSSSAVSLTMEAIHGLGRWDGQIHVEVGLSSSEDVDDPSLYVRVVLAVPKTPSPHKVPKSTALTIVQSLCDSMVASIATRTRQSLARKTQSARFQGTAQQRAKVRKHTRFTKMKEIEEMAADRRRRWQRQNPNSGHYRPSGDRMRSPNNAVYH